MIPLPGLELLVWMIRIAEALFAVTAVVGLLAVRGAHSSWRENRPAATAERMAWIVLVPDLVCVILVLPPTFPSLVLFASMPAVLALGTLAYVRVGNRRREHASLGRWPVLRAALGSLAGTVLLLYVVSSELQAAQARAKRLNDEAIARGQREQDDLMALALTDREIVVAGTTSTPPAVRDDAWMMWLDDSLAIRRRYSPQAAERQAFFALAADGSDVVAGGQDDEQPFWIRMRKTGEIAARKSWAEPGGVYAVAAPHPGWTLVVGERNDAPFISCVDSSGTELWSRAPFPRGRLLTVVGDEHHYLAAGTDDPLAMPGCAAILAGGTTDGRTSWEKKLSPSDLAVPEALARAPGSGYLALGRTRDLPGHMEDLWLARIAEDGTVSAERKFGDEVTEHAGGIATLGDRVFVAGYRFTWPEEQVWLFALDARGTPVWERSYGSKAHGRPLALAATHEGRLVAAGYRQAEDGHRDGWVAVFDTTGRLLRQRTYP